MNTAYDRPKLSLGASLQWTNMLEMEMKPFGPLS
jgi:hypothetical protein